MSDALLHLYHRLPGPARAVAASLRGLYLRSWRYGPETERLVEEALERERWSATAWRAWRGGRLAHLLHRAATPRPAYPDPWAPRRPPRDRTPWGGPRHLPPL